MKNSKKDRFNLVIAIKFVLDHVIALKFVLDLVQHLFRCFQVHVFGKSVIWMQASDDFIFFPAFPPHKLSSEQMVGLSLNNFESASKIKVS